DRSRLHLPAPLQRENNSASVECAMRQQRTSRPSQLTTDNRNYRATRAKIPGGRSGRRDIALYAQPLFIRPNVVPIAVRSAPSDLAPRFEQNRTLAAGNAECPSHHITAGFLR